MRADKESPVLVPYLAIVKQVLFDVRRGQPLFKKFLCLFKLQDGSTMDTKRVCPQTNRGIGERKDLVAPQTKQWTR